MNNGRHVGAVADTAREGSFDRDDLLDHAAHAARGKDKIALWRLSDRRAEPALSTCSIASSTRALLSTHGYRARARAACRSSGLTSSPSKPGSSLPRSTPT